MHKNILTNVSFHDQEILDLKINNNDLTIIANDDLEEKYIFNIKNIFFPHLSNYGLVLHLNFLHPSMIS